MCWTRQLICLLRAFITYLENTRQPLISTNCFFTTNNRMRDRSSAKQFMFTHVGNLFGGLTVSNSEHTSFSLVIRACDHESTRMRRSPGPGGVTYRQRLSCTQIFDRVFPQLRDDHVLHSQTLVQGHEGASTISHPLSQ